MSWSYNRHLISFMISFNLQLMSVTPDIVEDIANRLDSNTNAIVPAATDLIGGEINVVVFQPNCRYIFAESCI